MINRQGKLFPAYYVAGMRAITARMAQRVCITKTGTGLWALAGLFFALQGCINDVEEARLVTSRVNVNLEKGEDVTIRYSDNGIPRITAHGPTVIRHSGGEKPYLEFSDGITLCFFTAEGDTESTLTARYATAVENSREMIVRDHVVVINQKGERLDTDELVWDEEKKIIYSNSFVKITTANEIIYGKGMTANQNFTDYVVKSISGTIKVDAAGLE